MAYAYIKSLKEDCDWSPAAQHVALVTGELSWRFLIDSPVMLATRPNLSSSYSGSHGSITGLAGAPMHSYPSLRMLCR